MPPSARLLDLSRLASRLGQGALTGIDRVELAYLRELAKGPVPLFGLVRTGAGYCLLDRTGATALGDAAQAGGPLPPRDLLSRLTRRGAGDTVVRRLAVARCWPPGLRALLRRHLPKGAQYLNTGHSNLTRRVFGALRGIGARTGVFVHDVIPLEYPQFTRPDRRAVFARRMARVSASADLVIYNSADTRMRAERHFARFGRVPEGVVAHLGITRAAPDPAALPPGFDLSPPYFLALGTLEPRKNHALLLDAWAHLPALLPPGAVPRLILVGRRGWNNRALFDRLDALRDAPAAVVELGALPDAAVAALFAQARALLFPSHAEGFGLPLIEAMAVGCPAICSPLAVFREMSGDYPVYLEPDDPYSWAVRIAEMTVSARPVGAHSAAQIAGATWDAHFRVVLGRV